LSCVVIERTRSFADLGVVENRGKTPGQFPGLKERRPVDEADELGEIVVAKGPGAEEGGLLRRRFGEVGLERVGARIRKPQALLVRLAAEMSGGDLRIFIADLAGKGLAPVRREQGRGDADRAARIIDM